MMRAISVIGYSKSGKTFLVERIIQQLTKQGYKVASAKNIHIEDFTIDKPGKDSWRHWQAGAIVTVSKAPKETAVLFHGKNLDLWRFSRFFSADFLVLEGFRNSSVPKILCVKTKDDLKEELPKDKLIICISGIIAAELPPNPNLPILEANRELKKISNLVIEKAGPILPDSADCKECRKTCQKLAIDILFGKDSVDSCRVLQRERIIGK